jgi:YD repeat-containing protein
MDRLTTMTYPGGNVVTQSYTPSGQIVGIGLDGGTVASYEYKPVGATTAKNIEPLLTLLPSTKSLREEIVVPLERPPRFYAGFRSPMRNLG